MHESRYEPSARFPRVLLRFLIFRLGKLRLKETDRVNALDQAHCFRSADSDPPRIIAVSDRSIDHAALDESSSDSGSSRCDTAARDAVVDRSAHERGFVPHLVRHCPSEFWARFRSFVPRVAACVRACVRTRALRARDRRSSHVARRVTVPHRSTTATTAVAMKRNSRLVW